MNTIVISLERRTDRRAHFMKHLPAVGIDKFHILDAVDGRTLKMEVPVPPHRPYFSFKDEWGNPSNRFNRYQVACIKSHVSAMLYAQKNEWDPVLILEDDVQFSGKYDIDSLVEKAPKDYEFLYLGYAERNWGFESKDVNKWWKIPRFTDCIHAYVINQSGMNKMASALETFRSTADDMVNILREEQDLKVYALKEKIAFQMESFSDIDRKTINRKDTL